MVKETNYQVIISELVRRSNEDSQRLRGIEQRLQAVENRLASLEESGIERMKKINIKLAEADIKFRNIENDIIYLKNSMEKISRQISSFARRKDIKEIEKMFELLSPMREFEELKAEG